MRSAPLRLVLAACAAALAACSGAPVYDGARHTIGPVDAGRARIVDAVRDTLVDAGYRIDRVDAARGVVTTAYRTAIGSPTPVGGARWARRAVADTLNQHEHGVRVEIDADNAIAVEVLVRRVGRPAWRIETESPALSSHARVLDPSGDSTPPTVTSFIGHDGELASWIGRRIERRLADAGGS